MSASNIERGIQLFEMDRYEEAIKYLNDSQVDGTAKYYLALCYHNLANYERAEELANALLGEFPEDADILFLKARIALQQDKNAEALDFVNQAIAFEPEVAEYFGLKGALLFDKKNYDQALHYINEGLKLDPKSSYCLNLRAQVLTKLNRVNEADETVQNILYDNPEDSYSHANVGWVSLENGNHKKALHHFKQALQFDPNFEYAREGMSTAIKSKNFIYRWYLKYAFWMSKKSSQNQWGFIIGIYVAYRILIKVLGESGLEILAAPLIIAYLVFALGGWIMEPLSNVILGFDSYGKYLLNKEEKNSGIAFGALLLVAVVCGILFYSIGIEHFGTMALAALCALVPLPGSFLRTSKNSTYFSLGIGLLMLLVGAFGLFIIPNMGTVAMGILLLLVAYTWLDNLIK